MSVPDKARGAAAKAEAADDVVADDRLRTECSCLPPFCFRRRGSSWSRRGAEDAPGKKRHRRRRFRLSWLAFSWPWLRKGGGKKLQDDAGGGCTGTGATTGKKQHRRGRRLLLLLKTSMQAKKALASVVVVSGGDGSGLLPQPATVTSFGDGRKLNRSEPRPTAADGAAPSGARSQPRASTAAAARGATTRGSTAPARPGTTASQPWTTTADDEQPAPTTAGRVLWRAPSRRHSLRHQPERPAGLWTAATTLGAVVLFGRVAAVVFLCSCLYGVRFVRVRAAGANAGAKSSGVAGASSSRRSGDTIGVAAEKVPESCVTEESKKKVVMA